jgi:hypothetical protein
MDVLCSKVGTTGERERESNESDWRITEGKRRNA